MTALQIFWYCAGPGSLNGAQLAALGVRRVGIGGAMVRMALTAFVNAAQDMLAGRDELARLAAEAGIGAGTETG